MNAHDPSTSRGNWARWFGLGGSRSDEDESAAGHPGAGPAASETPSDRRRRQILDDLTRFLDTHRLPVTAETLGLAHDIVTGADPPLVRLVTERVASGAPLTLEWLEQSAALREATDGAQGVHTLARSLERAIAQFAQTATRARTAASGYNKALAAHVDEMGASDSCEVPCSSITTLTTIAREMLRRTRDIEREMNRSERETQTLQQNLEDARREAEIDHLTGLPNRRAFEAVFAEEFEEAQAGRDALCVAFCDIDRFKRINDTHGHEAGDRVLRTVAQALAELSNDRCHVARHGGEEFVVLLRGSNLKEACAILDDAREALSLRRLVNRVTNTPFGRISFSAGVADAHAYADRREALRAADEALFRAKLSGRNRVMAAGLDDWAGFRVVPAAPPGDDGEP
ncbi:GGDEF domain-containing protein [Novosphingobium sp. 1949]|uniref:diguanylate cyclase n=1 Tax=Novosphingobium organovorum TaxID=2930092 RepID=A0ABT0BHG3_9SPHN|nr:GGDEF domain-containing protein [Novosphingobium organovorum]MCJ2184510.1 GGDEF domain-containing protein [Novosphingobium organovorum]